MTPKPEALPAPAPAPSSSPFPETLKRCRDEAVYHAVRVAGRTQADVARQFEIHQSTVSRAVERVQRRLAAADAAPPTQELTPREQERLDHWLHRQRHDEIYIQSMRLARRMESPALATRKGERASGSYSEETSRDQAAAAASFLRTAQRSADALLDLERQAAESQPLDEPALRKALLQLREKAEAAGRVPKSESTYLTVMIWLDALLGHQGYPHPPECFAPGSAIGEMARAALSRSYDDTPEHFLRLLADSPPSSPSPSEQQATSLSPYTKPDPSVRQAASLSPPNPEPETMPSPALATSTSHFPETWNLEPETVSPEPETWNLEPETLPSPAPAPSPGPFSHTPHHRIIPPGPNQPQINRSRPHFDPSAGDSEYSPLMHNPIVHQRTHPIDPLGQLHHRLHHRLVDLAQDDSPSADLYH